MNGHLSGEVHFNMQIVLWALVTIFLLLGVAKLTSLLRRRYATRGRWDKGDWGGGAVK
jgi:hypothetical protein